MSILFRIFAKDIKGWSRTLNKRLIIPLLVDACSTHPLNAWGFFNIMQEKEIWKDINGFEGLYQVSNFGNIKSLPKLVKGSRRGGYMTKEKILKPQYGSNGRTYTHVCLRKNGKTFIKEIHRIVAQHFIPNPNNLPQVNHKDENPANNAVENLEWCDGFYNHNYGTIKERTKATKEKNKSDRKGLLTKIERNSNNAPKRVVQKDKQGNVLKVYESSQEAQKETGILSRNIRRCCNGEFVYCGGYKWSFL